MRGEKRMTILKEGKKSELAQREKSLRDEKDENRGKEVRNTIEQQDEEKNIIINTRCY